jgi:uncharacterized protein (DUF1501 family)
MNDETTIEAQACADCARSDSMATDLRPVDHMPIPVDAMVGFPDGMPKVKGSNRRDFIRNGALGFAAVYGASKINWQRAFEAAVAEAAEPGACLVMIYLNGGMDGLNAIVPAAPAEYSAYATLRPNLKRLSAGVVPAAGEVGSTLVPGTGSTLAFANLLLSGATNNGDATVGRGFDGLWGDGSGGPGSNLAYWPAVHFRPSNGSHFDAADFIFGGALQKQTTGWLGRWLDLYGSTENPLQAVTIGSGLSKSIRTHHAPVCAVNSMTGFGFRVPNVSATDANVNAEVGALAGAPAAGDALARSRGVYGLTVNVAGQLRTAPAPPTNPLNPAYPRGGSGGTLSSRLETAAALLGANLGTRIVTIDWGSFDTHGTQAQTMDPQLQVMSRALAAFQEDLTARGLADRVLTVVFTEFGRRLGENDPGALAGTDHGAGGPMWVMGNKVRGGLAGNHPSLTTPAGGNLAVETDFRTVWQGIINEWMGGDSGAILPKGPFPGIVRPDGQNTLLK